MAVYKIFASADASIYSSHPALNAGLDEILEVSVKNSSTPLNYFVESVPTEPLLSDDLRRSLILFDNNDLQTLKSFRTGSWQANLRLYLANAENLNTSYSLEIAQVHDSWTMGTGKAADVPETRNGVCWYSTGSFTSASNNWGYNSFGVSGSYYLTPGGGSWEGTVYTQSFSYKDNKDINVNLQPIVDAWFNGFPNYGFIVKHPNSIEQNKNSYIALNFFSVDTHTIYPPTIEMKWDDSYYNSGNLSIIDNSNNVITLGNNIANYKYGTGKYKMIINARDKYPVRTFTTSSFYTTNKALPQTSYWAIQDAKNNDIVIDFDTSFTKISCDGTNSYFYLYMSGLEPERYYKVLIRTVLSDGESYDIDNDLIFKVVR
jgi:hypothetical protein